MALESEASEKSPEETVCQTYETGPHPNTPVSEVVDATPVPEVVDATPVSEVVDATPVSEVVDAAIPVGKRKVLPSEAEKIRQSVMFGSVFLALESEFFTYEALLEWLCTAEYSIETRIAYKAVCVRITPNDQYLEDKYHFLTKRPEYASIALSCGLNEEIPDHKPFDPTQYNPILAHMCETLGELCSSLALKNFTAMVVSGQGTATYLRSNLEICYKSRNFPFLRISAEEINSKLVEADWFEKFRYNSTLADLVVRRVAHLQREAPFYYASVAYKVYRNVVLKLNKEKLFTNLSRDELATIDSFFPGTIDRRLLEYSDLAYKIAVLTNDVAGYILGFPIQDVIPNDDQINSAIQYLTDHGSEAYSELIREHVSANYLPALPFHISKPSYSNDTDVMLESPDGYVPFDIVSYQAGLHVYRFTRPEFPTLIRSKKNHWTNEWLPPTVLSTIRARYEAAKELGLPPPRLLTEMLERVENGSLFQPDDPPVPRVSSQSGSNAQGTGPRVSSQSGPNAHDTTPPNPVTPLRSLIERSPSRVFLPQGVWAGWEPGLPQDPAAFPAHRRVQPRIPLRSVDYELLASPFLISRNLLFSGEDSDNDLDDEPEETDELVPDLSDLSEDDADVMQEVD